MAIYESGLTWGWMKKLLENQGIKDDDVISYMDFHGDHYPLIIRGPMAISVHDGDDLLKHDPRAVECDAPECDELMIPESPEDTTCMWCAREKMKAEEARENVRDE